MQKKHGMRYTKLRGLQKIKMEVSLIFSCMNLKISQLDMEGYLRFS